MPSTWYRSFGKRLLDLLLVIPALTLLAPVLGLLALLVRLKLGGPVLFRQQRAGRHGQPFAMLKLRTMANARDARGRPLPDAERLTPFGSFLRRASLDELPELLNVLKGDMSLVGPRPLLMTYLNRYTPEQMRRHEVVPGMSGWAQVNGRNGIAWDDRLAMDVWYVDNQSLLLDIKTILLTLRKVLAAEGICQPGHASMSEFRGDGANGHAKVGAGGPGPHYSPELKARAVLDVLSGVKSLAQACREYGIEPDLLARWQADFLENAARAFYGTEQQRQDWRAELERMVDAPGTAMKVDRQ